MSSFDDRKKGFESKFAHDEETLFKINAKRNKFLGEWVADKLKKTDKDKEDYILEVIKANPKNIAEEELRLANLNNQRVNENYNMLSNMCYSRK